MMKLYLSKFKRSIKQNSLDLVITNRQFEMLHKNRASTFSVVHYMMTFLRKNCIQSNCCDTSLEELRSLFSFLPCELYDYQILLAVHHALGKNIAKYVEKDNIALPIKLKSQIVRPPFFKRQTFSKTAVDKINSIYHEMGF